MAAPFWKIPQRFRQAYRIAIRPPACNVRFSPIRHGCQCAMRPIDAAVFEAGHSQFGR